MVAMLVIDYSGARPTRAQLNGLGCGGVMRYAATGQQNAWKVLGPSERDRLWAEGFPIGLVWEQDAGRPKGGYGAGVADAIAANQFADRLAWPGWVPLAYAVDFDPTGWLPQIVDYFRGVLATAGRPVGSYGAFGVVEALAAVEQSGRRVVCHWQCAGWSGPAAVEPLVRLDNGERRRRSLHACMVQDLEGSRLAGTDVSHVFGPVDFLYHPDQPAPSGPHPLEAHMARTLNGRAAGIDGTWTLHTDAFGVLVRRRVQHPPQERLLAAAEVVDGQPGDQGYKVPAPVLELPPELAGALAELPEAAAQPATAGMFALTGQIIGQVTAQIRQAVIDIHTGDVDTTVNPTALADAVVARITPGLEAIVRAGVDAELDAAGDALSD